MVEERVEDAGAGLERVGDAEGDGFGFGRFGSGEVGVDGFAEEFYPAFELFLLEREDGVLRPGTAFVFTGAKEHGAPEGIHCWEMMFPIDFGDFVEDGAENVIAIDAVVEGIHEDVDVLVGTDIGTIFVQAK